MTTHIERLDRNFYDRPTLEVAKELLGKRLVRIDGDRVLAGFVDETECYVGTNDLGCHARSGLTRRNRTMWGPPGCGYVYFTYGMHFLLNVVTEGDGFPGAVLVRSLVPVEGIDTMRERRNNRPDGELADGPAKLCQALGIDLDLDGVDLCDGESELFLTKGVEIDPGEICYKSRVGLNSVPEPWKSIRWNFSVNGFGVGTRSR